MVNNVLQDFLSEFEIKFSNWSFDAGRLVLKTNGNSLFYRNKRKENIETRTGNLVAIRKSADANPSTLETRFKFTKLFHPILPYPHRGIEELLSEISGYSLLSFESSSHSTDATR